ncbi:LEUCINE-RICH REPEAT RECEPTOR-LIKE SERINE/THREONINE-PROTEIN KINASE-RELATED [Salix koriyanagi]|uniref:LEUCINE-RICH REPEAT RECEPTOR-LIKE SERINE/THREONINE-PROTEIN KINASE-RELATED n=2 Tax=Salix TaxID=40685 RepID=A0A9Q0PV03_9ROSI|nr:LEUCINE-RICH REPEAT RECEPTOR-LIKE SERINE/THREONINE-PROTEIN KINASE-RELATED [Salix koriyanagi]
MTVGGGNGGVFENMGSSTANLLCGSIGYIAPVERVVDSSLMRASRDQSPEVKRMWEVAITELAELGILCTQESPATRPTMLDAADDLDRLKRYLGGDTTVTFASSLGISSSTFSDD